MQQFIGKRATTFHLRVLGRGIHAAGGWDAACLYASQQQHEVRGSSNAWRGQGQNQLLGVWRRQWLMRVHPDLFAEPHYAHQRALNERSLQAFHALTSLAFPRPASAGGSVASQGLSMGDTSRPLLTFHFFLRAEQHHQGLHSANSNKKNEQKKEGEELEEVRYEFNPPPHIRNDPIRLRRAAGDAMRQLFVLANILPRAPTSTTPVALVITVPSMFQEKLM